MGCWAGRRSDSWLRFHVGTPSWHFLERVIFLNLNLEKNQLRNQENGEKNYKSPARIQAYNQCTDFTALRKRPDFSTQWSGQQEQATLRLLTKG